MTTREALEKSSRARRHGGSVVPKEGAKEESNGGGLPGLETAKSTESEN